MSRARGLQVSDLRKIERTAIDWELAEFYTEYLRSVADTDRLIVSVGRHTSARTGTDQATKKPSYAAGVHWPESFTIELSGALVAPDTDIDALSISRPSTLAPVAVLHGVALHEVGHFLFTDLDFEFLATVSPQTAEVVYLLEESRMERRLVRSSPSRSRWLRVMAMALVTGDVADIAAYSSIPSEAVRRWAIGRLIALTCARVDAGVLRPNDAAQTEDLAVAEFGDDLYDDLRSLWLDAQDVEDGDTPGLIDIAGRWCDLLHIDQTDPEPAQCDETDETSTRGPSSGPTAGRTKPEQLPNPVESADPTEPVEEAEIDEMLAAAIGAFVQDLAEEIADDVTNVAESVARELESEARNDAQADQRQAENDKAAEAAREVEAHRQVEQSAAQKAAATVFAKPKSSSKANRHTTTITGWRASLPDERIAAHKLGHQLSTIIHRPPSRSKISSELPPGRLNVREEMRSDVQRSLGYVPTGKPWASRRIVRVPPLDLRVGLVVDRTGSMRTSIESISAASWIVAEACRLAGGRFAATSFGMRAEPLCKPGTIFPQVPLLNADAAQHAVGTAIEAVRGALHFADFRATRLLVIASDAKWFEADERLKAYRQIAELQRDGVAVILMHDNTDIMAGHGCSEVIFDPANFGTAFADAIIGQANRALKANL